MTWAIPWRSSPASGSRRSRRSEAVDEVVRELEQRSGRRRVCYIATLARLTSILKRARTLPRVPANPRFLPRNCSPTRSCTLLHFAGPVFDSRRLHNGSNCLGPKRTLLSACCQADRHRAIARVLTIADSTDGAVEISRRTMSARDRDLVAH